MVAGGLVSRFLVMPCRTVQRGSGANCVSYPFVMIGLSISGRVLSFRGRQKANFSSLVRNESLEGLINNTEPTLSNVMVISAKEYPKVDE